MSKLGECDVFFTCRLGVGIPTKCSEGLHYSEEVTKLDLIRKKNKKEIETVSQIFHWSCVQVGTCVWARDSQRVGCGVSKEPVMST